MNKLFLALGLIACIFGQAFSETLASGTCASGGEGLSTIFMDTILQSNPTTTGITLAPNPINFFLPLDAVYTGSGLTGDNIFRISMGGYFLPSATGTYTFRIDCDDGDIVSLDGNVLIMDYSTHSSRNQTSAPVYLHAGQKYFISIDYFNNKGTGNFQVLASYNGGAYSYPVGLFPCAFAPTALSKSCTGASSVSRYHFFAGNSNSAYSYTGAYAGSDSMFTATRQGTTPPFSLSYPFAFKNTFAFLAPSTGTYRFAFYGASENFGGFAIGGVNLLFITGTTSVQNDARISAPVELTGGKYYSIEYSIHTLATATAWRITPSYSVNGGNFVNFATSNMKDCQQHGVVAPYRVSIATAKEVSIPVRLRTPPTGKVSVIVKPRTGVNVSPCILYFDQTNWNVPQYVIAVNSADGQKVDFVTSSTADANYDGTDPDSGATTMILGTPSTSSSASGVVGAMCTSWGDPHIVTFDGKKFDNQGFGDYYLVRTLDAEFVVQARQGPCGSGNVACQYALAVKYGAGVFHLYFDKDTGVPFLTGNAASALYGSAVSYDSASRRYTFTFPNAYSVVARLEWWAKGQTWFISVYISVPTDVCGTRGVCGFFDNNPANDLMLPDGSLAGSLSAFLNSYVVPTSEKLLNDPDAIIPELNGVSACTAVFTNCTVDPTPPPPVCTTCVPPPPPPCTTCTCDITQTQAEVFCYDKFVTNGPAGVCPGVNITVVVNDCVTEIVQMCDYDIIGPVYEYIQKECCLQNPLNCPPCDSGCNGNGNCNAGTCECTAGYSGPTCVPDGTPCSVSATPANPGPTATEVVVSGAFFPTAGSPVTCVFTSTPGAIYVYNTNGVTVSEFEAKCPLPTTIVNGVYDVVVKQGLAGDNCGAQITKSGGAGGDPHFYGFNGEKMEVKKDENAANQIYHLFCSESVSISTLFYEYPDKLLFMTRFWVRLGETMFTLNLSPVPKLVTSHEPAVFIPELGRFRIEIPDGHLEWDDSKLRVVYKYLRINFSNHIYLNGDAYMNIDFSGVSAPTETKVSGIIGRTVYSRLTNDEFAQYEQYRGSVSDVVSFTCPL